MRKDLMLELIAMITHNEGMLDRLIAEHRRGDHGQCTCSTPNDRPTWPCILHVAAEKAAKHAALVAKAG